MTNTISGSGIQIDTLTETRQAIEQGYKDIYGEDINLDQNTPDGQLVGIQAQAKQDMLDFSVLNYQSRDVDAVGGSEQDTLYKINGVYRKQSRFSFVQVDVSFTSPVNLKGLDLNVNDENYTDAYTVADTNGNQFLLTNSQSITQVGTILLEFRAKDSGQVEVAPNTIQTMITVLGGISGVNNPAKQYITGETEETDEAFRLRRNRSTAIAGQGINDGLRSQLESLQDVSFAEVWENRTNLVDSDGIPAHGIWTIVEGGNNEQIARTIYNNLTNGAMKGDTQVIIIRPNGLLQPIYFDRPDTQSVYIKLTCKNIFGNPIDANAVKEYLYANLQIGIYKPIDTSMIVCSVLSYDKNITVYNVGVSADGITWLDYLMPSSKRSKFVLEMDKIEVSVE